MKPAEFRHVFTRLVFIGVKHFWKIKFGNKTDILKQSRFKNTILISPADFKGLLQSYHNNGGLGTLCSSFLRSLFPWSLFPALSPGTRYSAPGQWFSGRSYKLSRRSDLHWTEQATPVSRYYDECLHNHRTIRSGKEVMMRKLRIWKQTVRLVFRICCRIIMSPFRYSPWIQRACHERGE